MKKSIKKLIGILVAVVLCFGLVVSFAAFKAEAATTYASGNWTYTLSSNIATITGYTGSSSSITFPTTLGGYKVEKIDSYCFEDNSVIKTVVIPEGYKYIGENAFANCSYLQSVSIPKSMVNIGSSTYRGGAFYNCIRLETVTLAEGGTHEANIYISAFGKCSALKSITIPANYKLIDGGAFEDCTSLKTVVIKENSDKTIARKIGSNAFDSCTSLTSIAIPEGFAYLDEAAFANCSYLQSVSIPKSMVNIGSSTYRGSVFYNCIRLETVTLAEGGTHEANIYISAFGKCSALKSITIPANYKLIDGGAFEDCTSLKTVVIKENSDKTIARKIGSNAFDSCTSLTSIAIPEGFAYLDEAAFANCLYLQSVSIPKSMVNIGSSTYRGSVFYNCIRLETVTFTEGGTHEANIYISAFGKCSALKSVTIPANYKLIDGGAFEGCTSLKTVVIKENSDKIIERKIGSKAFNNCTSLTSIVIPEGFVQVEENAFAYCTSLESATIPKTMVQIGSSATRGGSFANCSKLKTVTLAEGGTKEAYIYGSSFAGCTSLENIVIPSNYKVIEYYAFSGCSNLTSVVIVDNSDKIFERSIENNAFEKCPKLAVIHIPEGFTNIDRDVFNNHSSSLTICSTSYSCTAKTYADSNSIKFKLCDGNHGVVTPTPNPDPTVSYVLSYSANGGSGAPSSQSGAMSYTVSYSVPTRSGYKFLGWSKSGSATYATYVAGDTIILNANTTLYAVWQKNSSDTPPVVEEKIPGLVIKNNSGTKQINYGETLELTAIVTNKPANATIVWYVDGEKKGEGEKFNVSFESGTKWVEVTLVDENGDIITDTKGVAMSDSQTVTVKAGFFQKLISFFKNLFGMNRTVVQSIFKGTF